MNNLKTLSKLDSVLNKYTTLLENDFFELSEMYDTKTIYKINVPSQKNNYFAAVHNDSTNDNIIVDFVGIEKDCFGTLCRVLDSIPITFQFFNVESFEKFLQLFEVKENDISVEESTNFDFCLKYHLTFIKENMYLNEVSNVVTGVNKKNNKILNIGLCKAHSNIINDLYLFPKNVSECLNLVEKQLSNPIFH